MRGWVPTANGRLSFRHVGESRNPTESRNANLACKTRRIILAYQRRPLSDALFSHVVHFVCGMEGSFWFVLTAESIGVPGDTDELTGKIYIYKSKSNWRGVGEPIVRQRLIDLSKLANSLAVDREDAANRLFDEVVDGLEKTADIEVNYHLFRTGEIYIGKPIFIDPHLRSASLNFAETTSGLDFNKWMADQAYFFLRDITHVHQHHSPSSDTILILQNRDDEEDFTWRRRIIFALNHYIIRSKRFPDSTSLFQASGVLAYCESFQAICMESTDNKFTVPRFNNEALRQSINSRVSEITTRATEKFAESSIRITKAANTRIFALTFAAIVTALIVMLVQPMIDTGKYPKLHNLAEALVENARGVFGFLILGLVVIWAYTSRDWQVRTRFGRDVLETSNYRRIYFALAFVAAAALVIWASFYLGASALADLWETFKDFWNALVLT
jgi:hypothetical protein